MIGKVPNSSVKPQGLGITSNSSTYGQTIPIIYGRGQGGVYLIWSANVRKGDSGKKGKGGGKKGKGGPPTYVANADCLIGTNPLAAVLQAWDNNQAKLGLTFAKYSTAFASSITIPDALFYCLLGVTATLPYDVTFSDYGGPGAQSLSGSFELPLWNYVYGRPNPAGEYDPVPYFYRWMPGSGPTIEFEYLDLSGATINFYYAQMLAGGNSVAGSANESGPTPLAALRLTFEGTLGSGPEYGSTYAAQQILYPHYAGVGSANLDLGVSGMAPALRLEILGSYPSLPSGDTDFTDMAADIFGRAVTQAALGGGTPYTQLQRGLSCYEHPGVLYRKTYQFIATPNPTVLTYEQPNTAGNFLIVAVNGLGGSTPSGISDTAGNTWTPVFSTSGTQPWQLWYAQAAATGPNTVTFTNSLGLAEVTLLEIAGVDTLDALTTATGTSASITTTNAAGTPGYVLGFTPLGSPNPIASAHIYIVSEYQASSGDSTNPFLYCQQTLAWGGYPGLSSFTTLPLGPSVYGYPGSTASPGTPVQIDNPFYGTPGYDTVITLYMSESFGSGTTFSPPDKWLIYDCYMEVTYTDGTTAVLRPTQAQAITTQVVLAGSAPAGTSSVLDPENAIDGDPTTYAEIDCAWFGTTLANSMSLQVAGFAEAGLAPTARAGWPEAEPPANALQWPFLVSQFHAKNSYTLQYRLVQHPGTYSLSNPDASAVALLAFKCANPPNYPKSLGNLLDQASLLLTRDQCRANGLWGSLVMDSQQNASDWLEDIYQAMNAAPVWSGFKLKSIPYSEVSAVGNGAIYNAPTASGPVANLTESDFIGDSSAPLITIERKAQVDVPNLLQIQHPNRNSDYNDVIVSQPETGSIALYGPRKDSPKQMRCIQDVAVARMVLGIAVRKQNYLRNTYKFKLKAKWKLLEPMDLVTINDSQIGISALPVRLTSISEDENYQLDCEAEPFVFGCYAPNDGFSLPTTVPVTTPQPYQPHTDASPGRVNTPIIFEPLPRLYGATNQQWLWLVVSAPSTIYGGCQVYLSTDGGSSYNQVGQISGSASTGVSTADWPAASDPDTANDLPLDLTESLGTLSSYQASDRDNFVYPCYVDGGSSDIPYELMTYNTATLTAANQYTLKATGTGNELRRAVFGAPAVGAGVDHPLGSRFAWLGPVGTAAQPGLLKLQMDPTWIGKVLHFKFPAFNHYLGALEALSDCVDYTYTPTGTVGSVNPSGAPSQLFQINGT